MPIANPWARARAINRHETAGALLDFPEYGWRLNIAPSLPWSLNWARTVQRLAAKTPEAVGENADPILRDGLILDAYAEACVVSWVVRDESGEPLECTPDNVREVFRVFPEIYAAVQVFAANPANYPLDVDDLAGAIAGNSSRGLPTSSVTGKPHSDFSRAVKSGGKRRRA